MKIFGIIILIFQVAAHAAGIETTVHIKGMTCPSCAASVERELKKFPQVSKVSINLRQNTATIEWKAGQSLPRDQIKNAVENAGYRIDEGAAH